MKLPWRKIADVGLSFGKLFVPGLTPVLEGLEVAIKTNPPPAGVPEGQEKHDRARRISTAFLEAGVDLSLLTPDEYVLARRAQDQVIHTYVKFRDAETAFNAAKDEAEETVQAFKDLLAKFKARQNEVPVNPMPVDPPEPTAADIANDPAEEPVVLGAPTDVLSDVHAVGDATGVQ